MEAKGIRTDKGELNRWIKATNRLMLDIKKKHPASSLFRAYNSVPQLLRNGYIGSITYAGQNVNIKGLPFSSVVRLIGFQSISFPSRS